MAASPTAIGQSFVDHYYKTFDLNRAELAPLYLPESQLTFEGQEFRGREAIVKKLVELPFKAIQHVITTRDVQLSAHMTLPGEKHGDGSIKPFMPPWYDIPIH